MQQPSRAGSATSAPQIVVMGVSGSGKTTVGLALADRLGRGFVDGDSLHPAANVAKMAAGHPLDDADRRPWLYAVRDTLRERGPVVVACSALRRRYRDVLREAGDVVFVFLDVDRAAVAERLTDRRDHFMPAELLDSQFRTLERPGADEIDVLTIDADVAPGRLIATIVAALAEADPGVASPGSSR